MPIIKQQTGQGVTQYRSTGTYNFVWAGKAFNPNDEGILEYSSDNTAYPNIIGQINSFNIAGVNAGTEIALCLLAYEGPEVGNKTVSIIAPDGTVIHNFGTFPINLASGFWSWEWAGTGFRHQEIATNGTYTYRVVLPSGTYNHLFTISGITTSQLDRHTAGYCWVEGDTIAYIDGCYAGTSPGVGYKHNIPNDGYNGGTGTPGHIWVDSSDHGKLYFVDALGIVRRTILGDFQGVTYDQGEMPQTPGIGSAGYIWVENSFHWTYLKFIANNGKEYRLSHVTNLQ